MLPYLEGKTIQTIGNFSSETMRASEKWHNIFQVLKVKHHQPRILHPAKQSFSKAQEIKT